MKQQIDYDVFFANQDHKKNFQSCIEKFHCRNREYTSACFLAAYPEIFKCFSLQLQVNGPFDWYYEHLEDAPQSSPVQGNTAPLTGQTTALVRLGLNLWNGHEFDLAVGLATWDSELYKIALQAIDLRRNSGISIKNIPIIQEAN